MAHVDNNKFLTYCANQQDELGHLFNFVVKEDSDVWNVTPPQPSPSKTTGTSTNWNFACKVTMPGPWAAWIRAWIETDSLWKLTVAVGVHARSLHLLIGWTKKTLDCIRSLILPLSNLIPLPTSNWHTRHKASMLHSYAAQKKKKKTNAKERNLHLKAILTNSAGFFEH